LNKINLNSNNTLLIKTNNLEPNIVTPLIPQGGEANKKDFKIALAYFSMY
jgi:hypothetical protein